MSYLFSIKTTLFNRNISYIKSIINNTMKKYSISINYNKKGKKNHFNSLSYINGTFRKQCYC